MGFWGSSSTQVILKQGNSNQSMPRVCCIGGGDSQQAVPISILLSIRGAGDSGEGVWEKPWVTSSVSDLSAVTVMSVNEIADL